MARFVTVCLAALLLGAVPAEAQAPRYDIAYVVESTTRMAEAFGDVARVVEHQLGGLRGRSPAPEVRVAVVDYKDRGDDYLTRPFDFVPGAEAEKVFAHLRGIPIGGGGDDYYECAYSGVMAALNDLSWDAAPGVTRLVVLIAGAPPKKAYTGEPELEAVVAAAKARGVRVDVVGLPTLNRRGARAFEALAEGTGGAFARFGEQEKGGKPKPSGGKAYRGGIGDGSGEPAQVTVERYPTMEYPGEVAPGETFDVMVSLTEEMLTPGVKVKSGKTTAEGKLLLSLPDRDAWTIRVTLSAPGFDVQGMEGRNFSMLELPREGDSSPAMFTLTAKPVLEARKVTNIYAMLMHETLFLGRIVGEIAVVNPGASVPGERMRGVPVSRPAAGPERVVSQGRMQTLSSDARHPDMLMVVLEGRGLLEVSAFGQHRSFSDYATPSGVGDWLEAHYARFVQASARGLGVEQAPEKPVPTQDRMRGFGRELYRRYAPPSFKEALWQLRDRMGDRFRSIQILTDNPLLPWELMVPSKPDGSEEMDFLGLEFRVARWHISESQRGLETPPQTRSLREVVVIAPEYSGRQALPAQAEELEVLQTVQGFRRLPGQYGPLKSLFQNAPEGIIHFVGHGVVGEAGEGLPSYAIQLEGFELDLTTWRGLTALQSRNNPFIFFNACEVGQAHRVASFVDGWAPAVLEAGSSGYIGGLWPLGDRGAAEFATHFYGELERRLRSGPVAVADLLQEARRKFYETGDPTYLAYVYYGDPNFQFVRGR